LSSDIFITTGGIDYLRRYKIRQKHFENVRHPSLLSDYCNWAFADGKKGNREYTIPKVAQQTH
jgi:hypothetical protein